MASKITIPDLKKIRVTDPLFSHYADMVAKKMIPVQWEILNGKQGQSRCFCIARSAMVHGNLRVRMALTHINASAGAGGSPACAA